MNKIQTTLSSVVDDIKSFYNPKTHHFLTLNGVAHDEKSVEVQWIFNKYAQDDTTLFFVLVNEDEVIPSITDIIPSAIISQRELVDMFGLQVEDSQKGLYLDEDSLQKPLSLGCAI
ncbi:MAG: NADH-quinone oxidoreductase subunit C [Campylobacterales bacterium]|nr:NADH-quinone oxidoreductase subunit C [Campylobacterales bacterium]